MKNASETTSTDRKHLETRKEISQCLAGVLRILIHKHPQSADQSHRSPYTTVILTSWTDSGHRADGRPRGRVLGHAEGVAGPVEDGRRLGAAHHVDGQPGGRGRAPPPAVPGAQGERHAGRAQVGHGGAQVQSPWANTHTHTHTHTPYEQYQRIRHTQGLL